MSIFRGQNGIKGGVGAGQSPQYNDHDRWGAGGACRDGCREAAAPFREIRRQSSKGLNL